MRPAPGAAFLPAPEPPWTTLVVDLPAESILVVCAAFEAHDNLAIVRTPVQGRGRVHVACHAPQEAECRAVLSDLARNLPLRIVDARPGLGLDSWED